MKKHSRLLSLALAFALMVSLFPALALPALAESEEEEFWHTAGDWRYSLSLRPEGEERTAIAGRYLGANPDAVLPETLDGYRVTSISNLGMSVDEMPIHSITLPKSIDFIGNGFGDVDADSDLIETNAAFAFKSCSDLTNIYVDAENPNFKDIDGVLFTKDGKKLLSFPRGRTGHYEIPSGVEEIGALSFAHSPIEHVAIPGSVTRIGNQAFRNTGLTDVTITGSVVIEPYAFEGCSRLTSVVIPDSVTSIGEDAFAYCSGLTSVVIPDSVTSIGGSAFVNCSGLTSVVIPDSVTSIGSSAFVNCDSATFYVPDQTVKDKVLEDGVPDERIVIGSESSPVTPAPTPASTPTSDRPESYKIVPIVGGAIVVLLLVFLVVIMPKKRKKDAQPPSEEG